MVKKMILALIAVVTMGITACAESEQDNNVDRLFRDFASEASAEYVKVPRFMVWVGTTFAIKNEPGSRVAKKVRGVRVLELSDCKDDVKARFYDRVEGLRDKGLDEIMRMNDSGEKVRIYGKVKGDDIKDLLMLCEDGDGACVLVEVKGKFGKEDIAEIMDTEVKKYNGGK